jgi:transposase-like protein
MAGESRRCYLFVAIDRATREVFIRIFPAKTAATARRFLRDLDRACPHRIRTILTPFHRLQPNHCRAMARFNGRIEEGLQGRHFRSGEDTEATLHGYARLYNQQLPQLALRSKSPLQALKDWHTLKPTLLKKRAILPSGM